MSNYLFTDQEELVIVAAIKKAELNTSGEIRVHIEKKCKENVMDHAAFIFDDLEMEKTKLRNGVLIYVGVEDRVLAILGDKGINEKVPTNFWDSTKDYMVNHFKKGEHIEGLVGGIKMAGDQLKKYFPYKKNDKDELPNEISFGE